MSSPVRRLVVSLLVLMLAACQGSRVHETPAPSYPDSADPAPAQTGHEPRHAEPALTAPPPSGAKEDYADEDYADAPAAAAPRAEQESSSSGWDGAEQRARGPSLGAGRAAPRSKRATRDDSRSWSPPQERPGLATHWGETRYSPARQVDFERASARRPAASHQLHYNSRRGAQLMLPNGHWSSSELSALGGSVRLSMVNAHGERFSALRQGERLVTMGDPGERYALLIENHSGERFEAVVSVDGLDVLDGENGDLDKRGYLVNAYSSVLIDGFRRSNDEVAAFRLGDVGNSYAASKGKARNVGVIGFALFDERQPDYGPYYPTARRRHPSDIEQRRSAEPFPGSFAQPPRW
jgi:hypothetical protein